jgi:hypothetical protein
MINKKELKSTGSYDVYVYGDKFVRTVYRQDKDFRFFVKMDGEFLEVYRKGNYFTTRK